MAHALGGVYSTVSDGQAALRAWVVTAP